MKLVDVTPVEPLDANQMVNVMLYIRWRAEGKIPVNPRIEDYLAGRPLREDDGVYVRATNRNAPATKLKNRSKD